MTYMLLLYNRLKEISPIQFERKLYPKQIHGEPENSNYASLTRKTMHPLGRKNPTESPIK